MLLSKRLYSHAHDRVWHKHQQGHAAEVLETLDRVAISLDGKGKGGQRNAPPPKHRQRRKGLDRTSKAVGRLGMSGQLGSMEVLCCFDAGTIGQFEPLMRTSVH